MLFAQKNLWRIVPLVAATLLVGIGAYFVGLTAIRDMQRSHADYVAKSFARYLVDEVPALATLIESDGSAGAAIIGSVDPIGTIISYRVYDMFGRLRADSAQPGGIIPGPRLPEAAVSAVLATRHVAFSLNEGDGVTTPRYASSITIPLMKGSQALGALTIVSDETETWPDLFEQFRTVLLQVGLLILVASGIPLLMYLRQTGQLANAARHLRHTTQYDELTGCLNRATFTRIMDDLIANAGDRGLSLALHFVDLDRFKDVNESQGHAAGDEVLKQTAERLRKLMGTRERIARLGADEFAICQPYYVNSPQVVVELANEIVRALTRPFEIGDRKAQIGASVGYSFHPTDGRTVAELMRAADIAIHNAKEKGRGKAMAFDPAMETERQRRQVIEARMREALVENGFDIHFQPLFEAATNKLRGFEALLRLSDHYNKPISPAEFIPIAEEVGLISDIGTWVLRESCRMARTWPDHLVVSVNLSPAQFASGNMAKQIQQVLEWADIPPRRLELEVTESLLITDTDNVLRELRAIKALGISVALDDFGTGYSSLSYLWRFPFDKLKVDKSFMTDLAVEGGKSREILSTIIALGKVLGLKVTAEGVETEQQAAVLRELNCDLVQGYLFGRPMRAIDVAAILMREVTPPRHVPHQQQRERRSA
jgi:diguanylate cyclase (GGDEF)-like protein